MHKHHLTIIILLALLAGIVAGGILHEWATPSQIKHISEIFSTVTEIFLRLIKMIIAPLVFATLVAGITHMKDARALGRIGARTLLWFLGTTMLALTVGLLVAGTLKPGIGFNLPLPQANAAVPISAEAFSLKSFITNLAPTSFFDAMATNNLLQIIVFSIFTGVGLTALGEKAAPLTRGIEALSQLMLRITRYVMYFAPPAVFSAVLVVVMENGLGVLLVYLKLVSSFYFALILLWGIMLGCLACMVGMKRTRLLPGYLREPLLIAFSTASSEAAFPKIIAQLERFGVPGRIVGFVLPLGYSFNLDGSAMYCTFAVLFIAQIYGIDLPLGDQITLLFLLLLTSKGMAGVPRASLVVIAGALTHFGIPEAGLLLILGVDQFLDMGRSATNVVSNAVAATAVARWEGNLRPMWSPDDDADEGPEDSSVQVTASTPAAAPPTS